MTLAHPYNPAPPPVDPRVARRAVITWTSIILSLLIMQILLCFVGVYCATKGKSTVVEADYYNKALHWDEKKALLRASQDLGWSVALDVGAIATTSGDRALMLNLKDKSGAPITDATVNVAYFHHARPLDLRQSDLKATANGLYASSLPLDRRGLWEFRLTIRHNGQTFIETLTQDLLQ